MSNAPIECEHLSDGNCEILSLIASQAINAKQDTCQACLSCSRPKRLNEHNISLLPEDKIEAAIESMELGGSSIGDDLSKIFGVLIKKKEGCGCSGTQDAMNAMTLDQVKNQKEQIIHKIHKTAVKMGVPWGETAIRMAINAVILKRSIFDR